MVPEERVSSSPKSKPRAWTRREPRPVGRGTGAPLARGWRGSAHTREAVRPATPFWQRVATKLLFIMIYGFSAKGSSVFESVG